MEATRFKHGAVFDVGDITGNGYIIAVYYFDIDSKKPVRLWVSADASNAEEDAAYEIAKACMHDPIQAEMTAEKKGLRYVELRSGEESLCMIYHE